MSTAKPSPQPLRADVNFLKSAAQSYAVIDDKRTVGLCAVYARGDRRCRPMGWISQADVSALYQHGHLKPIKKGLAFTYTAERALLENRWRLSADAVRGHDEDQEVYVPSGVKRHVKTRHHTQILTRLAKDCDTKGRRFFSADELEAGARFQRDYDRAFGTGVGAQNFTPLQVDVTRQNQEELSAVARLDASQSYRQAKAVLGAGLEQAIDVICGEGKSFSRLEREQYWARGSGRTILKLALQRLAEHYGTRPGRAAQRARPVMS